VTAAGEKNVLEINQRRFPPDATAIIYPAIEPFLLSFSSVRRVQLISEMPYPETAEGFMVNDQKNWSTFTKQEVSTSRKARNSAMEAYSLSSSS